MSQKPSYEELEQRIRQLEADARPRSGHELANFIENAVVGFYRSTPRGRFQWVNTAFAAMLGYETPEALLREEDPIQDRFFVDPRDREVFISRIRAEGRVGNYEFEIRQKKGGRIWVSDTAHGRYDEAGNLTAVEGVVFDITRRRASERALEDAEAFTRSLFNSLPVPVFYKDRDSRYRGFNRAFEIFFGKKRKHLIGKSVFEINPPELARIYKAKDDALFASGGTQRYETQVEDARGEVKEVIFDKSVYRDSKGEVLGIIGTVLDISDRKAIEKERENLIAELQEALSEIKTLKGIVPICSKCKKIRDDQGYWNILETFIQEHSQASFSHGLCPECSEALYGDHDWFRKLKDKNKGPEE